jgi:L-rhamnose-H+ transport protein
MHDLVVAGALLALLSGVMNGLFTMPMRYMGRWSWENVWSIFILGACVLLPIVVVAATAPSSFALLANAPRSAVFIAILTGFAWGFGAIMFGQSVSAIGISLANTFVLAISSALGSLLPIVFQAPAKLHQREGHLILAGIAIEIVGIALCGRAGLLRERAGSSGSAQRGDLVGKARPLGVALLLVTGSGLLSAVFNIGFSLAQPIASFGQAAGLTEFCATNLIWILMLGGGAVSNLGYCGYLFWRNSSIGKFAVPGSGHLLLLASLMSLLWGGSIFVYGAATPKLGPLGPSIGWPISLATGLLIANIVGLGLGEWKGSPTRASKLMLCGIGVLIVAIIVLSRANG